MAHILNKPEIKNDELFTLSDLVELKYQIILENKDDIYNLFTMTPYYYKTSKEDTENKIALNASSTSVISSTSELKVENIATTFKIQKEIAEEYMQETFEIAKEEKNKEKIAYKY